MRLIEEKGDLFKLDTKYALAHCISLDCAMGAGIAVEFDKNFKGMKSLLLNTIKENHLKCPITISIPLNFIGLDDDRVVFNLITKEMYWHKPTYETITMCIKELAECCKVYGISYLAMPKIGCGLDRLRWSKVRTIIEEEFRDLDVEIVIRYL